jgi:hypothetical protein
MGKISRRRQSESAWREIVARQEQSGLTIWTSPAYVEICIVETTFICRSVCDLSGISFGAAFSKDRLRFLDKTNSAVSTSALSLRRSSCSSYLTRRRSSRVS